MQNNKSILIVGNGPSSSYKAAGKLAKGCEVARTNWFFLEKEQIFGKQVDYLFHAAYEPLINYIYFVLNTNDDVYHINNNIDLNNISVLRRTKHILKNQMTKIDIHAPRDLSKSYSKHYETTGLVMLKYFLKSGYQTIHIVGIDFYQGGYQYLNTKNAEITKLCSKAIKRKMRVYTLHSAHNLACDINYLSDLLTQYPDVKIIATSCHPETTKIWQQFKQVEVMEFASHQKPEIYDAYLDKQWLQKAVDDFSKKYSFITKLFYLYPDTRSLIKIKLPKIYVFLRDCKRRIVGINR
jgi:hypothetical protein